MSGCKWLVRGGDGVTVVGFGLGRDDGSFACMVKRSRQCGGLGSEHNSDAFMRIVAVRWLVRYWCIDSWGSEGLGLV